MGASFHVVWRVDSTLPVTIPDYQQHAQEEDRFAGQKPKHGDLQRARCGVALEVIGFSGAWCAHLLLKGVALRPLYYSPHMPAAQKQSQQVHHTPKRLSSDMTFTRDETAVTT